MAHLLSEKSAAIVFTYDEAQWLDLFLNQLTQFVGGC